MMKKYFLAVLLVYQSQTLMAAPTVIHYPSGRTSSSLLSLKKVVTEPAKGTIKLTLVLRNLTDESNGNGLEKIIQGIKILRPLPPCEWFTVVKMEASQGKLSLDTVKMPVCKPALLGRLEGFIENSNSLDASLIEQLKKIQLRLDKSHPYWLVGHTDDIASRQYNQALSLRRAVELKKVLESAGFNQKHLTLGRGERQLLVTTRQDRQRNRRVEIFPANHPRLHWQVPSLKPDEEVTLSITLKPRPWANDVQTKSLIQNDICYKTGIHHQKTVSTKPKLRVNTLLRPDGQGFDQQWKPEATLSQCDRLQVQVAVSNQGERSAKRVKLISRLPKQWQVQGLKGKLYKQRKTNKIVLSHARLWPQQEWMEHYQILPPQGKVKNATELHKLSAQAKGGFTAPSVTNKVHWRLPELAIEVEAPSIIQAGEPITQKIKVRNDGNWPIHELILVGNLPKYAESISAAGAIITDNLVTWQLNKLSAGAEQTVQLSFSVGIKKDIARLKTQFIAYDQAYGDEKNNHCVKAKTRSVTQLAPPKLVINAQLRPEGPGLNEPLSPNAKLSQCDALQVQVGVTNQGGLSAKKVQLVSNLPKGWQLEGIKLSKNKPLVLKNAQLWPQEEWIEHYKVLPPLLKGSVKSANEIHKLSARAKGGLTATSVTNQVNWHLPQLAIEVEAPSIIQAGEPITQKIKVRNDGDWPIHELTLVGQLPKYAESISAAGAIITDNLVTWQLKELSAGAEQTVQLSFSVAIKKDIPQLETHFIAYDQAYGEEKNNHCVKAKTKSVTQLAPAQLVVNAQLRPPGINEPWSQDVNLSQCDRLQIQVAVTNNGGLSAKEVQLVSNLPKEWQLEGIGGKRIKGGKNQQIVFTNKQLWPQQQWIEHYQALPPGIAVKSTTQVHKVSASNQAGLTAETVTNQIHWHLPQLSLHAEAPERNHAGEPFTQQIRIHNEGDWPIHQLTLIGNLPAAAQSITTTGARINDNIVTWQLNELSAGSEKTVTLTFSYGENKDIPQLQTHFLAYDQAYGDEKNNPCVKAKTKTVTQVGAIKAPRLKIVGEHNALPIGSQNQYHFELFNPNPLPMSYLLKGKVDPKVLRLITQQTKVTFNGNISKKLKIDINKAGEFSIHNSQGSSPLSLAANSKLSFKLTFQIKGLGSQALKAIANNMVSNFDVTDIIFQVEHELVSSQAVESTVIYQ